MRFAFAPLTWSVGSSSIGKVEDSTEKGSQPSAEIRQRHISPFCETWRVAFAPSRPRCHGTVPKKRGTGVQHERGQTNTGLRPRQDLIPAQLQSTDDHCDQKSSLLTVRSDDGGSDRA